VLQLWLPSASWTELCRVLRTIRVDPCYPVFLLQTWAVWPAFYECITAHTHAMFAWHGPCHSVACMTACSQKISWMWCRGLLKGCSQLAQMWHTWGCAGPTGSPLVSQSAAAYLVLGTRFLFPAPSIGAGGTLRMLRSTQAQVRHRLCLCCCTDLMCVLYFQHDVADGEQLAPGFD